MPQFTLAQALSLMVRLCIICAVIAHAQPILWWGFRGCRYPRAQCSNSLRQLWVMQANYRAGPWGGRDHLMPRDTGSDFWTCLSRTQPPLIDASLGTDIFDCPLSPTRGDAAHCEYRGPASDVNLYANDDPVGACDHGDEGIVVLRKSGVVMLHKRDDPVAVAALALTRP